MSTTSDGIDGPTATLMLIRCKLMNYFKDLAQEEGYSNLIWEHTGGRGERHFEQDTINLEKKYDIYLDRHRLLSVRHEPDTITLHLGVLDRSRPMRQVLEGLRRFLRTYLPGVTVEEDDAGDKLDWHDDRALLDQNVQNKQQTSPFDTALQCYSGIDSNILPF